MEWTNSRVLELLDLYRKYTALWDPSVKEYRDRHKRKDAYKEMAVQLGCTADDVESKINRLRSQYNRELAKEKHYESCGSIYKSRWFAFDIMATFMNLHDGYPKFNVSSVSKWNDMKNFLFKMQSLGDKHDNFQLLNEIDASKCIKVEQDSPDMVNDDMDMDTPKISIQDFIPMANSLKSGMGTKKRYADDDSDIYDAAKKLIKGTFQCDDSLMPFGLHVVNELRQLNDPHSLAVAKFKINEILFKAAMGIFIKVDDQEQQQQHHDQQQQQQMKMNSGYAEYGNEKRVNTRTSNNASVMEQKNVLNNLTLQDSIEEEFLHVQ